MEPLHRLLWDHAGKEIGAIKSAPIASVLMLGIGLYAGSYIASWKYEGSIQNLDTAGKTKDATIMSLRNQLDEKKLLPTAATGVSRDPDGIFQLGRQVGSVQQPYVDETSGSVSFASIIGANRLNSNADFEYRDFVLHIKSFDREMITSMAGQQGRALGQVKCEIVGRVQP